MLSVKLTDRGGVTTIKTEPIDMPNWSYNHFTISGKKESVKKMFNDINIDIENYDNHVKKAHYFSGGMNSR